MKQGAGKLSLLSTPDRSSELQAGSLVASASAHATEDESQPRGSSPSWSTTVWCDSWMSTWSAAARTPTSSASGPAARHTKAEAGNTALVPHSRTIGPSPGVGRWCFRPARFQGAVARPAQFINAMLLEFLALPEDVREDRAKSYRDRVRWARGTDGAMVSRWTVENWW